MWEPSCRSVCGSVAHNLWRRRRRRRRQRRPSPVFTLCGEPAAEGDHTRCRQGSDFGAYGGGQFIIAALLWPCVVRKRAYRKSIASRYTCISEEHRGPAYTRPNLNPKAESVSPVSTGFGLTVTPGLVQYGYRHSRRAAPPSSESKVGFVESCMNVNGPRPRCL